MPAPQKKLPVRQCVGCREHRPKRELIRVIRSPEGTISLDNSGKANGRGAYLCRNAECLRRAVRSSALERALNAKIPPEVTARLEKELESVHDE